MLLTDKVCAFNILVFLFHSFRQPWRQSSVPLRFWHLIFSLLTSAMPFTSLKYVITPSWNFIKNEKAEEQETADYSRDLLMYWTFLHSLVERISSVHENYSCISSPFSQSTTKKLERCQVNFFLIMIYSSGIKNYGLECMSPYFISDM